MTVEILKDALIIRVGLELADANQAATIVNAVVHAYLAYNGEHAQREFDTPEKPQRSVGQVQGLYCREAYRAENTAKQRYGCIYEAGCSQFEQRRWG